MLDRLSDVWRKLDTANRKGYYISITYAFPYKTEMRFIQTQNRLQKLKVFSTNDLLIVDPDFRLPTLYEWEKKGYVQKIRNKWYFFSDNPPTDLELYYVANKIYSPSYISMELALNHHGVIPEAVANITSVSTLKTKSFDTVLGVFRYNNIKNELFFGYEILEINDFNVKVATIEKALLDYFYLTPTLRKNEDLLELRLNLEILKESLDKKEFIKYSEIFNNDRVSSLSHNLIKKL